MLQCIGFNESALSAEERRKLDAIVASQPAGDLLALRVYPNVDVTRDDDIGSGIMAVFRPDAVVDATLLGDALFQHMAVTQLPRLAKYNDAYFVAHLDAIKGAVDQFSPTPLRPETRNPKDNSERAVWAPELGGPGSLAGVYSKINPDNHRAKDYVIVARGSVPLYAATYRQLFRDPAWQLAVHYGSYASQRNAARVTQNVAEACEISIDRMRDLGAKVMSADHALPERALPTWEQRTHSIREIVYEGQPAVALCYGLVIASDALMAHDKRFFTCAGPYDGIASYQLKNYANVKCAMALPADTGRKVAVDELGTVPAALMGSRAEGITWDRSTGPAGAASVNPDLHPNAFRPIGKDVMKQFGWHAEDHVERLVPVAVKIWNDALVRV